jgi:hypothetical protein
LYLNDQKQKIKKIVEGSNTQSGLLLINATSILKYLSPAIVRFLIRE